MKINYRKTFENQLFQIVNYIAKDKIGASENFSNELEELIFLIPNNPFKYRSSIYFNNRNI